MAQAGEGRCGPGLLAEPLWVRDGRPLVLIATAPAWRAWRAAEEIGDAIYPLDPGVVVEVVDGVILVYSSLDPWRAFAETRKYPPAYAERVMPVEVHLSDDPRVLGEGLRTLYECRNRPAMVDLEVRLRSGCKVTKEYVYEVVRGLGVRLRHRAPFLLRIELLCPLGGAALLPDRLDRVALWRQG